MWTPRQHLGELGRVFAELERRFDFLAEIDSQILNRDLDFRTKLERLAQRFAFRLARADAVAICFPGKAGYSICVLEDNQQRGDELAAGIRQLLNTPLLPGKVLSTRTGKQVKPSIAALLLPIKTPEDSIFSVVVVLTTKGDVSHSHLKDPDIIDYADRVLSQLSVLVEGELRVRDSSLQASFIRSFFDSKLDRETTLTKCLEAVVSAIPDWEYKTESKKEVLVQLVSYAATNQPLTIDAQVHPGAPADRQLVETDIGKPVPLHDSVTGSLVLKFVKDASVKLQNIDPNESDYKDLYKAFLGKTIPHSELMAVMLDEQGLVGILNLEHAEPNYFSKGAERAVQRAAEALAPFVRELNRTFDLERKRQSATLYAMFGFLERLSATFKHKTGQSIYQMGKRRRDLKQQIDGRQIEPATQTLKELNAVTDEYIKQTNSFMTSAPHYIGRGKRDLRSQIDRAVSEVRVADVPIDYMISCDGQPTVYASDMLQEHLFNLLSNSVFAIKARQRKRSGPRGLIKIDVETEEVTDSFGTATGGKRVKILISDNGTGVDEDFLPSVGELGKTTKGNLGTGFGVFAATDYIKSLGGKLRTYNIKDEKGAIQGFAAEMFLDVFDPSRHKEEKFGKGRAEVRSGQ